MTPDKVEAALGVLRWLASDNWNGLAPSMPMPEVVSVLTEALAERERDAARLDYIERTFSGMTNRERYLPVKMIWGSGAMGRTLREACDKHMKRDAAMKDTDHDR